MRKTFLAGILVTALVFLITQGCPQAANSVDLGSLVIKVLECWAAGTFLSGAALISLLCFVGVRERRR
ncbi:hypothetical protein GTO10_03730 [Candidatus Saccharibacteria bacterium]|nr:hypothetical protein [Candidatus Saccharibacteria bacterium]